LGRLNLALRIMCAIWLVVVFLGLLISVPYVLSKTNVTEPLEDPVVQLIFILISSSIPAAFGLAYANHRRKIEEAREWVEGL